MKNQIDPKFITQKILELENKLDLFNWKIDDVFVWQLSRVHVYTKIQELLNYSESSQAKSNFIEKLITYYKRTIVNSLIHNPFFDFQHSDSLVFESSVKYLNDNEYIDIYTEYLCRDLKENKITYRKYQSNYVFDSLSKNRKGIKHLDFITLIAKLKSKLKLRKINSVNYNQVLLVKSTIDSIFNININLMLIFEKEIVKYKSQYPLYRKLLKLKKPKKIYLVNYCNYAPLIKAAKDCKITVIELQHGLMVKEDLIYHYPNSKEDSLIYFPNKFFVWNNLNMTTCKLPLSSKNIINFENQHLNIQKKLYIDENQSDNQILVISQHTLTEEISNYLINNINSLKKYKVVYKLHAFEDKAKIINKLKPFENITIVGNEVSIYKLLSQSKYVIGVYSTAVFEATYFGCNIFLLDLPGVTMCKFLINNNRAIFVKVGLPFSNYINPIIKSH